MGDADIRLPVEVSTNGVLTLYGAALHGEQEIVELLLKQGGDMNAQDGGYGNVLQAAASWGKEEIVKLLLNRGADVNAQGGYYGNTLQAAAWCGEQEIVKLMLDRGADVNAQGGHYGNALQAAASNGEQEIIELLLNRGADINAQGGDYGNALQAAAFSREWGIVKLLLDRGADVTAQGGYYGSALQAATSNSESTFRFSKHHDIVGLLLARGADINSQGGYYGNALQAAVSSGKQDVIKRLLDRGADVSAQGGFYGNALQAAAWRGEQKIIKLFLGRGADVNAQCGYYGSALQAAASIGKQDIVELLLDCGADINAQGGHYGNTLQAAASNGEQEIIKLLLDRGANINAQGGDYGNALQAAASSGEQEIVKLLLDCGANITLCEVDFQGASLLHVAVACRDKNILKLLLEAGAGMYMAATDVFNQTPLHNAARFDEPEILQTLKSFSLDFDVNEGSNTLTIFQNAINEGDIDGCTPLHHAVENHSFQAAKWLITHGAKADSEDFDKNTPFQRASQTRDFKMMSVLFPNVTRSLIKASDWRACLSQTGDKIIILGLGGSGTSAVQVMNDYKLTQYLYAMSYSLDFSSSSISAHANHECIATAISKSAVVLLENDKLLGHFSSGGVYWRWWRKVMRKPEELKLANSTHAWSWKVQLNKIPTAAALRQPSRTECFLECRVLLPSCRLLPSCGQPSALEIEEKKHGIVWVMAKPDQSKPGESMLQSKLFFTTLEYCEIPNSPTELFRPCIRQLEEEWNLICEAAANHLSNMRTETFRSNGGSTGLIKIHLSDAETWTVFKRLHTTQIETLQSLCKSYDQRNGQVVQEDSATWTEEMSNGFLGEIEEMDKRVKKKILSLNTASQELIQLEFNLTSIAEAQKSTTMNRSMKRLSWITFIFLPLMFVASLFGMNINLLESNPSWWLYIPFAAGITILTLAIWIFFKSKKGLEDRIEQRFLSLFGRTKLEDEESLVHINSKQRRTMKFSAYGKKRS